MNDDDADNMTTKVTPWEDDFSDGLIDDGWSVSGTWLVEDGAAHKNAGASGQLTLGVTPDDQELTFSYMLEDVSTESRQINVNFRYDDSDNNITFLLKPSKFYAIDKDLGTQYWQPSATVTTTANTWYDVRVVADGGNVQFWRGERGEVPTKIFDFTAFQTTSTTMKLFAFADSPVHFDNVRLLADGMTRQTTFVYASNNELTSMTDYNGTTTFTYDDWGRTETETLPSGTVKTYSWTSANLLAGVDSDDPSDTDVAYMYRGDLKRIWRWEDGDLLTAYNWDAGFNVISEEDVLGPGSTQLARTYIAGLAEIVGSDPATGTARFLTHDHLGSTRGVFDSAKTSLGTFEFTPYGNAYAFTGPMDVTKLYTGHDLDAVTGNYYAPFRYLNPDAGRWMKQDPLGMINGPNMYAYVGGSPIVYYDSSGLFVQIFWGAAGGAFWGGLTGGLHSWNERGPDGNRGSFWRGAGHGAVIGAAGGAAGALCGPLCAAAAAAGASGLLGGSPEEAAGAGAGALIGSGIGGLAGDAGEGVGFVAGGLPGICTVVGEEAGDLLGHSWNL